MPISVAAPQTAEFAPYFVGDVIAKFLRNAGSDRLMQLRENFGFVESPSKMWIAPKGFIFDGATIPRALWTVFGDPFIGDYRRAAVIHDMLCTPYCQQCETLMLDRGGKAVPRYSCVRHPLVRPSYRISSDDAAETMYVAMITDGVSERRAGIIRRAVAQWGPQFEPRSLATPAGTASAESSLPTAA